MAIRGSGKGVGGRKHGEGPGEGVSAAGRGAGVAGRREWRSGRGAGPARPLPSRASPFPAARPGAGTHLGLPQGAEAQLVHEGVPPRGRQPRSVAGPHAGGGAGGGSGPGTARPQPHGRRPPQGAGRGAQSGCGAGRGAGAGRGRGPRMRGGRSGRAGGRAGAGGRRRDARGGGRRRGEAWAGGAGCPESPAPAGGPARAWRQPSDPGGPQGVAGVLDPKSGGAPGLWRRASRSGRTAGTLRPGLSPAPRGPPSPALQQLRRSLQKTPRLPESRGHEEPGRTRERPARTLWGLR